VAPPAEAQRARAPSAAPIAPATPVVPLAERAGALEALTRHVGDCSRCGLAEHRRAIVHATGPADARLAIVAEAPSGDDETAGQPFRGPAGELLEKMIIAMGLSRETSTWPPW
jgi:uracil-DNA glycosylase